MAIKLSAADRKNLLGLMVLCQCGAENLAEAVEALRDKFQDEYDERSEKWLESDAAQDAQELIGKLEDLHSRVSELNLEDVAADFEINWE